MKQSKHIFLHILNVITVALIIESFLCSLMLVRKYAHENCYERIEESSHQVVEMLTHSFDQTTEKLTIFSDILAANSSNPDELLLTYMTNFCKTGDFSSVCIHRANGTVVSYGEHPHTVQKFTNYEHEVARLPYVSEVYSTGDRADEKFFYQAIPIIRNDQTVGILYGYMQADRLPGFIVMNAFGGKGRISIVDGETGDYLMDTSSQDHLGNIYDVDVNSYEFKEEHISDHAKNGLTHGDSGYFVFRSKESGRWMYNYYLPIGINQWSLQLTVDEETAFARYVDMSKAIVILSVCVVAFMVIHVWVLMIQTSHMNKRDKDRLHKSNYMYEVQRALFNAHNNPDYIEQALKTVANEVTAETVLLLTFSDRMINHIYFWPSVDKNNAMKLSGRRIRDDFPMIFDMLSANESVLYHEGDDSADISSIAKDIFEDLEVASMMLVPIMDNSGFLRGAIAAVNMTVIPENCEKLECLTYDFFMAIANIDNHAIIKNMGTMDYLTKMKNRNSYELELPLLAHESCESLWCAFIDVNGLHEINNTYGHKAGDRMLCSVADAIKRVFNSPNAYRTGGDEFVTFVFDSSEEEMKRMIRQIHTLLEANDYHVSIGVSGMSRPTDQMYDIDRLLVDAETHMYEEKRRYYQTHHLSHERGFHEKVH